VLSLNFLKEFLRGNGTTEHPTLKLKDLIENDIKSFTNLFSNATPKSTKKQEKWIYSNLQIIELKMI